MVVHSVYFWLPDGFSTDEKTEFMGRVAELTRIPSVIHGFSGSPAETARPVIDTSYSCALILVFDHMAGHDAYQAHELHQAFLKDFASRWERVSIYDVE